MPLLTFPIHGHELPLTVVLGPNRPVMAAYVASGQPIPVVWAAGVLDTGTNITCVARGVLRRLGLVPTRRSRSQTASGRVAVRLFRVSLTIPPAGNAPGASLTLPDLEVMELPRPFSGAEVLIGMDVLLGCKLLLDGPARQFTLEF
jgi:hypothetical protein